MSTTEPRAGEKWIGRGKTGCEPRVMAVADGWVMARYKGCMPWVLSVKEFVQSFERSLPIPEAQK